MRYLKLYEYFMFNNMELNYNYEEVFRERFKEKEFTDDDFATIKDLLEKDCKEFLDELKSKNQKPIFRGVKNKDDVDNGIYIKSSRTDRRTKDSNPFFSDLFNDKFEEVLGVKLRSEGVFATKNPNTAGDYGTAYMFFPIGKYRYFVNKEISDLYSNISDNFSDERSLKFGWEYKYNRPNSGSLLYSKSNGSFSYNDKVYSDSPDDTIAQIKKEYPELEDKSYSVIKDMLTWIPAISWEDFLKEKTDAQNKMIDKIVSGYEEGKMEDMMLQEMTFICEKYYLVDTGFYDMMCNYLEGKHLNQPRVG
jgi:hypothetical protein